MPPNTDNKGSDVQFNGSNWQDLNRMVAQARFAFVQDEDYDDREDRKCAWLASRFDGPALDWVASAYTDHPEYFVHFDTFVTETRQAFGIADNNITALLRNELDRLHWSIDVPVFFAEFDRLTMSLGITSHEVRVTMVEQKLPHHIKTLFSQQALSFANYETMRERLNCMWATDPNRNAASQTKAKKSRCGSCGKKGHTASDCRSKN